MTKTAIVLGGGGALGWVYHAGVLAALDQAGLDTRSTPLMIGTSAGAAVAASARAGAEPGDIIGLMGRPPSAEQRERVLAGVRAAPKSLRPLAPALAGQSVRSRSNPVMALAGLLPRGWFPTAFAEQFPGIGELDEWPHGLWMPAVRARDGALVVFGRDRTDITVADAVAASSAVPGMFQPKRVGDHDFIDGGVVSPTHADLAAATNVESVVISSPMTRPSRRLLGRHAKRRLIAEIDELQRYGKRVIVVEPTSALEDDARGFPRRNPGASAVVADHARRDVERALAKAGV